MYTEPLNYLLLVLNGTTIVSEELEESLIRCHKNSLTLTDAVDARVGQSCANDGETALLIHASMPVRPPKHAYLLMCMDASAPLLSLLS